MMKRRRLLFAICAAALLAPLPAIAQPQPKVYQVGILSPSNPASIGPLIDAFAQRLGELGDIEGKNIAIERRFAEGNLDRLPALAAELVQRKVDVIFAPNTVAVQAARQAAGTIPIVFATVDDPVGAGFIASFSRPGGNITGVSAIQRDLSAKRVELLREAFPKLSRLVVLTSPNESVSTLQFSEIEAAAKALGMEVSAIQVRRRDDFAPALARMRDWRADSIYPVSSAENFFNRGLLAEFAAQARLPAIYSAEPYAYAGGLISYSPKSEALFQGAATYVHRILQGAKPADLPVEQPTRFQLVINLKTAKALGIEIPQSFLLRADEVIE